MTDIALFGTSADPPNIAHRAIVQWLSQHFDRVAVWASDNPLKPQQTPISHRAQMLKLTIESLQKAASDPFAYSNIEVRPDLSSPKALISVERAKMLWSNATFTFVVGSDLIAQMPRWYCAIEFLQQVRVLVIPRPGCLVREADVEPLRKLTFVEIAPLQMPDVSSTAYRNTKDKMAIDPQVAAYIDREQLYLNESQ
jgi:nicotinate-nucleotide adenylyltransferase